MYKCIGKENKPLNGANTKPQDTHNTNGERVQKTRSKPPKMCDFQITPDRPNRHTQKSTTPPHPTHTPIFPDRFDLENWRDPLGGVFSWF